MNVLESIKEIRKNRQLNIDLRNNNPYRILIKEENGLSAYYFSIPIYRESDKKIIDFTWKQKELKKVFQGVNANIEIEKNVINMKNYYGEVQIDFTDDIEVEPTFNGVAFTSIYNKISFFIKIDNDRKVRENENYFALMQDEFIPFLVVSGIVGRKDKECFPLKILVEKQIDKEYKITISCDEKINEMIFEINLQVPKLIFDTTVESKNPDKNNAFGGVAFLGSTKEYGEQWLYSRFDTMQLIDLNGYLVKEANLYIPKFSSSMSFLESYKMTAPWCSFGSTWNTKTAFSELLYRCRQNKKYEIVEVTDVIKDILRLNEPKNPGMVIKSNDTKGYEVVSTGDNYLLPQILEIKLNKN